MRRNIARAAGRAGSAGQAGLPSEPVHGRPRAALENENGPDTLLKVRAGPIRIDCDM